MPRTTGPPTASQTGHATSLPASPAVVGSPHAKHDSVQSLDLEACTDKHLSTAVLLASGSNAHLGAEDVVLLGLHFVLGTVPDQVPHATTIVIHQREGEECACRVHEEAVANPVHNRDQITGHRQRASTNDRCISDDCQVENCVFLKVRCNYCRCTAHRAGPRVGNKVFC